MAELSPAELSAIRAVARQFSATWRRGETPTAAWLTIGDRRIAVDVTTVAEQDSGAAIGAKPRFRDDKVARRVLRDLEGAVGALTQDGRTVIFTLGAPIRVGKQLAGALTDILRTRLASGAADVDEQTEVLGNRVRFRILSDGSAWTSKAVGFVFTGDPSPGDLARAMNALRNAVEARAETHSAGGWLILTGDWVADIGTYRRAFSRLAISDNFEKILMVFSGARVESLRAE